MAPLAKRVVLEWYTQFSPRMPKEFEWGCPICHRVYKKQTEAQRCCGRRKMGGGFDEHWLSKIELGVPIGFYYTKPEDYQPFKTVYERWLDFSTRLIKQMECTETRGSKILEEVKEFINDFDPDDILKYDIAGWDHEIRELDYCFSDHFDDYFYKYATYNEDGEQTGRFHNQLHTAIRAGLDMVVPDYMVSAGVLGFTIGDLREMYPEGLPDWLPGFVKPKPETPDDTQIWL